MKVLNIHALLAKGGGVLYLGRLWTDFENSKAVHLVWVTDEKTK